MVNSKTLGLILLVMSMGAALAQQAEPPKPNPLDVIPEKMPFATPYGAPISLARAQARSPRRSAEAEKRGWAVNVAVVDSGAQSRRLRAHGRRAARLDRRRRTQGARGGEIPPADQSLRGRDSEDDYKYILTLDGVIASRGGIPLIEDGKLIGAIGCSGATGSQDEAACTAGAATVNK